MLSTIAVPDTLPQPLSQTGPSQPFISVIVPVRNEEKFIRATLESLLIQHYDPERFEVLVADGRSTDATREIVRGMRAHYPNLRLLDNPRCLSSAGRNAGVRMSQGEILVIIDGHCELESLHYLRDLACAFASSGADCVGRPQPLNVSEATTLQKAIAAARSSRLGHHPDSHIYSERESFVPPQSVAIAYRRSVFHQVGLFDEAFDACEDVEFNHRLDRAGLRCFFTPKVAIRYVPRASLGGLFRQMMRYGRGRMRLMRKHPDTFSLSGFMPAIFLAGVVLGPFLILQAPWLRAPYAVGVLMYLLTVLLVSFGVSVRTRSLRVLPWLPVVFCTVHGGAGAGILRELLSLPFQLFAWVREAATPKRLRGV
jgi:succinoglycan biosynthesis protein ExoA